MITIRSLTADKYLRERGGKVVVNRANPHIFDNRWNMKLLEQCSHLRCLTGEYLSHNEIGQLLLCTGAVREAGSWVITNKRKHTKGDKQKNTNIDDEQHNEEAEAGNLNIKNEKKDQGWFAFRSVEGFYLDYDSKTGKNILKYIKICFY